MLWDFGDNSGTVTGEKATHLYTSPETYTVTVTVTYDNNESETASAAITVKTYQWSSVSGVKYAKSSNIVFSPDGQVFYAASADTPRGIYAFSAITGTQLWSFPTDDAIYGEGPAVGPDGTVYSYSNEGRFVALDAENGEIKWEKSLSGNGGGIAVDTDGTIYIGTSSEILAFDENGNQKWKSDGTYSVTEKGGSIAIFGYIFTGFALGADGNAYVNQYNSSPLNLLSFNASGEATVLTTIEGGQSMNALTIGPDNRIYYGSKAGYIYTYTLSAGLAESGWPMRGGNQQGTNSLK